MKRFLTLIGVLVLTVVTVGPRAQAQFGFGNSIKLPGLPRIAPQDRNALACKTALEEYEKKGCDGNCSDECRSIGHDLAQCKDLGNRAELSCTN
jgi:hypothetical protein